MSPDEIKLSVELTRNAQRLAYNLEKMKQSIRAFAEHLADVRSSGCWKVRDDPYDSFADFCKKELGITEGRASQIISARDTLLGLAEEVKSEPKPVREMVENLTEGHLRPLREVEPKQAISIIKKVAAKGKITVAKITEAVVGKPTKPTGKLCPHCGKKLAR